MPHEVRIIGGQWKRTRLPVLDRPGLRPTPDRVREALFNWLGQDLDGWRCLDAFAGTGALGFEAASRGAGEVTLLERDGELLKRLREAQERLQARQVRIEAADALAWMRQKAVGHAGTGLFDLVFLDPPFASDLFVPALKAARGVLGAQGWVYLEAPEEWTEDRLAEHGFQRQRHGRAGAVHFHLLATDARPVTGVEPASLP